jgi:hypothetical protein
MVAISHHHEREARLPLAGKILRAVPEAIPGYTEQGTGRLVFLAQPPAKPVTQMRILAR